MTDLPDILVEREEDLLRVTINRPAKRNALSREVLATLQDVFTAHRDNTALRAVVLSGAGDKNFAAGGDLRDLETVRSHEDTVRMAEDAKRALNSIRAFPVPVVAALNGDALGGGAELAMACDFRVAAAHAHIGFVQGRLNISTAWGGGIDLLRLVNPTRGLGLLCRAERVGGQQALELGLLDAVAAPEQGLAVAVEAFLAPFRQQTPQVLRAFKGLAYGMRMGLSRERLEELETRLFAVTWTHEEHWAAAERVLRRKDDER
jgi:enoyl-CoA hydratase